MTIIIFFGNGSSYSEAVFDQLIFRDLVPITAAIPFYGKSIDQNHNTGIVLDSPDLPFVTKLRYYGCKVIWAPAHDNEALFDELQSTLYDYLIVACWPYLLKPILYRLVKRRALNLHPSLLPLFPGPDPIGEQLKSAAKISGVTIHQLNECFDQGPVLLQARYNPDKGNFSLPMVEKEAGTLAGDLVVDFIKNESGALYSA
ncbi:MAG: methionyl-tRNA formyltransferase [Gammaproteobacteria bacterium]|jgi:methionyl-tRNA formyltransferase